MNGCSRIRANVGAIAFHRASVAGLLLAMSYRSLVRQSTKESGIRPRRCQRGHRYVAYPANGVILFAWSDKDPFVELCPTSSANGATAGNAAIRRAPGRDWKGKAGGLLYQRPGVLHSCWRDQCGVLSAVWPSRRSASARGSAALHSSIEKSFSMNPCRSRKTFWISTVSISSSDISGASFVA